MNSYTEIKDKLVHGQWIFTCSMEPLRFDRMTYKRNLDDYDLIWKTKSQKEQNDFINDDFVTIEGSHHSIRACSCSPISEKYALWFLENRIWEHFKNSDSEDEDPWEDYKNKVMELAASAGLEYEGI